MPDNLPARLRAGDSDRDRTLAVLESALASGRLTVDELGERQERALRAIYLDELAPIVADLPEARTLDAPGHFAAYPAQARARADLVPSIPASWSLTIMSGKDVDLPAGSEGLRNFVMWGGDDIHLGDALGPGRVVTVEAHALMGGHTLYVPEGVKVVDETAAIMAGNSIKRGARGDGSNGTLILRGFLLWGGHTVKVEKGPRSSRELR